MKPMEQVIEKFIKRIKNRLMLQKVISGLFTWMTVGVAAGLIVSVATFVVPFYYGFVIAVACVIAGALFGIVRGIIKSPDMKQAALIADSRGYKEKFYTAYTEKSDNIFMRLLKEEAAELAGEYDIKKNLPFQLSIKKLGIFGGMIILFVISLLVDTPARREAELKHQVKELAEEYADELQAEKDKIEGNDAISDEEKAEMLDIIDKALAELDGIEDYNELRDAENRTLMKMDIAAAYSGNEMRRIVSDTAEAVRNAQAAADALMAEKGYEVDKTSQYAASNYGNNSSSGEGSGNGDGTGSENTSGNGNTGSDHSSGSNSTGNGESSGDTSSGNNTSGGEGNTGSGDTSSGEAGAGSGEASGGAEGAGSGNASTGSGNASSGSSGNGNDSSGGKGGGWNTGNMTGQETDSAFDESITIPEGTVGNDDNLTGKANDTDSSYTVKDGQTQGFSGNKVSYGTVAGEYKNKAYSNLESSSYPDSMKDYIRRYFDGLN